MRMVQVRGDEPSYRAYLVMLDVPEYLLQALGRRRLVAGGALLDACSAALTRLEELMERPRPRHRERAFVALREVAARLEGTKLAATHRREVQRRLAEVATLLAEVAAPPMREQQTLH